MSSYGVCNLSIVPCRKEPSDKSEMVTQLLFGEHFQLLEEQKTWRLIRTANDDYECWIDHKQFIPVSQETYKGINHKSISLTGDLIQLVTDRNKNMFPVVIGSYLPFYKNSKCRIGNESFIYEGEIIKNPKPKRENIIGTALLYLNAPYLWGGKTPFGVDCSGFTQMVYRLNGAVIKRDARQQAEQGEALSFVEEAREGDLAFFDNKEGRIVHTGILLGGNKIIHASGSVRVDRFDHQGIFHEELNKYTHRLRIIKRFL